MATVKGDIHDIGKNIVKVLLENYAFDVIDLGKDVSPEKIVETAKKQNVKLVGLNASMTTTVVSMEETIEQLHKEVPNCKIMVGGAVLNQEYADDWSGFLWKRCHAVRLLRTKNIKTLGGEKCED